MTEQIRLRKKQRKEREFWDRSIHLKHPHSVSYPSMHNIALQRYT